MDPVIQTEAPITRESVEAEGPLRFEASDWTLLGEAGRVEDWCAAWLRIQSSWIGRVRRAVVCLDPGRGESEALRWLAQIAPADRDALADLIEATFEESRGLAAASEDEPDRFRVSYFGKLPGTGRVAVAVEVERSGESDLDLVLRQLQWGAAWLEHRLGGGAPSEIGGPPGAEQAQTLIDLIGLTLASNGFAEAAQSLVAQLARVLVCDRVSFGVEHGGRVRLEALSHSAAFGREMNLIRGIEAAMEEAMDQNSTLSVPETRTDAPLVVRRHQALARDHGAASILTIPVAVGSTMRGAFSFEHAEPDAFSPERIALLEAVAWAVAPILDLWRREDRSLLRKVFDAMKLQLERIYGRGYLGRKLVLTASGLTLLFFAVARGDYRVGATGTLEGASRRVIISPFDGYVASAEHRAGDFVERDELLARLDDREIELEKLKWASRLVQLERQSDEARAAREYGRTSILNAQIDEARAEIARLEERWIRTRVTAPFGGLIVSGDLSQSLGAAVSRGDVLFEVTPLERYRVLLDVDEEQVAEISVGQTGTLLLHALPNEKISFQVSKVTPVATARDGHNFFRVEGSLREHSERLRPGMEGVGKIEIDRRRLLWIWTRSFRNWLTLWVWSWWP